MFEPRVPKLNWLEEKYIAKFEEGPIVKNKILFYGPSNFTRWKEKWGHPNLEEDILMRDGSQACVNHGFGTSCVEEQLYFYPRAVRPWEPRALVLSAYGNHAPYGYSVTEVFSIATRILEYARTDFPGIKLFFCDAYITRRLSEKGPAAASLTEEYNDLVRHYCEKHPDTTLVQHWTYPAFFTEGGVGKPECVRTELYVDDHVHFNLQGYAVYREFFKEYLKDLL